MVNSVLELLLVGCNESVMQLDPSIIEIRQGHGLANNAPSYSQKAEKLKNDLFKSLQMITGSESLGSRENFLDLWQSGNDQIRSEYLWTLIVTSIKKSNSIEPWRQWVQWFKLGPCHTVFAQGIYWQLLCDGLQDTSREKQKICVFLVRKSVALIDGDIDTQLMSLAKSEKETAVIAVERFCRSYETIIVGRYLHQVRECLKAIPKDFLKKQETWPRNTNFELSPSWWIALLYASTSNTVSHRLATTVGNWLLEQNFTTVTYNEQFAKFLSDRFIPWATQGHLFRDSLVRDGESVQCRHGSQISNFISKLFRASVDQETVKRYLFAIITAISHKALDPRAIGFILQGMDCLRFSEWEKLPSGEDFEVTIDSHFAQTLYKKSSLNREMKRICDYHFTFLQNMMELKDCQVILEPEEPDISKSSFLSGCTSLEEVCQKIETFPDTKFPYLDLLSSITRLTEELNKPENMQKTSAQTILKALKKLWTGAQRSKFARYCARRLPKLLFGKTVILLSKGDGNMRNFLSAQLMELFSLSETKIYVWNPLTESLWRAYRQVPELSTMLPLDKFLLKFANKPPSPNQEQLLEFSIGQTFKKLTGHSAFPEVADEGRGHAFMFDIMNRLWPQDYDMGSSMIKTLMMPFLGVENIRDTGGHLPRQLAIVQALFILSERCHLSDEDAQEYRKELRTALKLGVGPRMRFFLEFLLVAAYWTRLNQPDWVPDDLLDEINCTSQDEDSVTKQTVSLIKVGLQLSRHQKVSEAFIVKFSNLLPTFSSFDKIVIKRTALGAFPLMMDIARERHINTVAKHDAFVRLDNYVRSLRQFKNPPEVRKLEEYNPITDRTLAMIFGGSYQFLENLPLSVVKLEYFVDIDNMTPSNAPSGAVLLGNSMPRAFKTRLVSEKPVTGLTDSPFQSKAFTYADDFGNEDNVSKKSDLVLVASLIDSPWNLGGLSRVVEIFGCAELHLADASLTKETAFTSTAVSSDEHVKFIETPVSELTSLCEEKREAGWIIVGVEQTDSSLILGDANTCLPKKAVVIMGAESTGIPPEILVECDICVEIKQWGVTRSLNVQTAAATVLYEWRRQHGDSA